MPVSLLSLVWDGNPSENGRSPRVWQARQGHQPNVHRDAVSLNARANTHTHTHTHTAFARSLALVGCLLQTRIPANCRSDTACSLSSAFLQKIQIGPRNVQATALELSNWHCCNILMNVEEKPNRCTIAPESRFNGVSCRAEKNTLPVKVYWLYVLVPELVRKMAKSWASITDGVETESCL